MSFTSDIKEELSKNISSARHCRIAEVAAIISLCGRILISAKDHYCIKIQTENIAVARKYFTLLKKTFNINTSVLIRQNMSLKNRRLYIITIEDHEDSMKVLKATKLLNDNNEIEENLSVTDNVVIWQQCCKRAFLRGAFMAVGAISDPEKSYHFEMACATEPKAEQIQAILASFDIDSRIIMRKKYFVVYIKEGAQIVDVLNIMEAHVALMEFENVRILKEIRENVNRKFNCETANISKTVSAAVSQTKDIEYIRDTIGFEGLADGLREIARARLERPEATLKELGAALNPPVGKSGVNHRLRKLSSIADALREERGETT